MIEIKHISKTFGRKNATFKALNDVSLNIEQGDIVGIIGFSGAGKSTLIRTVNLLEKPDSGKIIINGTDLTLLSASQLSKERKKIGMIFQHFNLLSSRTVFGNIAFPLELDHTPSEKIKQKVNELLQLVGLEDKANEYPKNLSGGQKQRVAIARALANDPYILLCDEATSALDPATTKSILNLILDINKRLNITVLLITHEMEVVKSICNHVAVIDYGKLVAKGTLEEILNQKKHPVIQQFLHADDALLPAFIAQKIQAEFSNGLSPVYSIELNGNFTLNGLLSVISNGYRVSPVVLKADVEYIGKSNVGTIILHLKGASENYVHVEQYLQQNSINHTLLGYAE